MTCRCSYLALESFVIGQNSMNLFHKRVIVSLCIGSALRQHRLRKGVTYNYRERIRASHKLSEMHAHAIVSFCSWAESYLLLTTENLLVHLIAEQMIVWYGDRYGSM